MKKHFFSFLLLISLFISVSAQTATKPDLAEKRLRTHVDYLASDKLEGRRTGERGATFAAGYVANMFSNFKLKAGYSEVSQGKIKTSFLQPFPFVTGAEQAKTGNEFRIAVANSVGQKFQTDNSATWKPLDISPNADVRETAVVFAGYGVQSDEPKYDDYAGLDIKNKIAIVFDGTPDAGNSSNDYARRFDAPAKAKIAKDKGARALLIISRLVRLEDDALYKLEYDPTLGEAALPVIVVSRKTAAAIFGTDLNGLNRAESLVQLKDETGLADLRTEMQTRLRSRAAFKINIVKKQAEAYNVVGILEGNDPVLKKEAIIIGAHYDHLGRGGQGSLAANSTAIHHGADDNASGVAGLIELARQFSEEKNNKRTIIFIAFGGEEEGLLGSKFYVGNPVFPLDKTVAMINMDMIGRLKDNKLTIGGIGTASEWKNLVEYRNAQAGSPTELKPINLPSTKPGVEIPTGTAENLKLAKIPLFNLQLNEDGFGPSDHSSFYGKQIPVLFFFTGTHTDYHKPTDTADKINYPGLSQVVGYVSEIMKAIDANPARPAYTLAKSAGMGEGRRGFSVSLGTIPSYAESNDGLLLEGVRNDSPAAKAGIKSGDKIIKLAGKEVRNISDYTFVLGEMKAGTEYEIVVKRGNETLPLKIIPAARKQN